MKPALLIPVVILVSLAAGAVGARFFGPHANAGEKNWGAAEEYSTDPAETQRLDAVIERLAALEAKQDQWLAAPRQSVPEQGVSDRVAGGQDLRDDPTAQAVPPALASGLTTGTPEDWFSALTQGNLSAGEAQKLWDKAAAEGKLDELVDLYKAMVAADPNNPDAQNMLGDAFIQKVQTLGSSPKAGMVAVAADKAYSKALELDPNHLDARRSKAIALSFWPPMMGKQAESIQQFEILIDKQNQVPVEPDHVHGYLLLGNMHMQMGKIDQAREVWNNGLSRFPGNEDLMRQLELTLDR